MILVLKDFFLEMLLKNNVLPGCPRTGYPIQVATNKKPDNLDIL